MCSCKCTKSCACRQALSLSRSPSSSAPAVVGPQSINSRPFKGLAGATGPLKCPTAAMMLAPVLVLVRPSIWAPTRWRTPAQASGSQEQVLMILLRPSSTSSRPAGWPSGCLAGPKRNGPDDNSSLCKLHVAQLAGRAQVSMTVGVCLTVGAVVVCLYRWI